MYCRFFFIFVYMMVASNSLATEMINVAAGRWGATASASSVYGDGYQPGNVLDCSWFSRTTDKWNSAYNQLPHWLMIDLGQQRKISRIVIRHEGVFDQGQLYNTASYRIQGALSKNGPWKQLVDPVLNNKKDITTHDLTPVKVRFVRMLIDKSEQNGNEYARIFEFEVFSATEDIDSFMMDVSFPGRKFQKVDGQYKALANINIIGPDKLERIIALTLKVDGHKLKNIPVFSCQNVKLYVSGRDGDTHFELEAVYDSGDRQVLASSYIAVPAPNYFDDSGEIHIVSSSHQDIAWMESPQFCRKWRDDNNITPALKLMNDNENYHFSVESMMYLMDELEDNPQRRDLIHKYTKNGQLEWGATYTQPYESLLSGEQLIRGMYLGRKWLLDTFPDCDSVVAWNPDVPGRAMQMPQVMHKAGIKYLMFSRHKPGIYRWLSPDGTGIIAFSPGHYGDDHFNMFQTGTENALGILDNKLYEQQDYYKKHKITPHLCLLNSVDFSKPVDFSPVIEAFNEKAFERIEYSHTDPFSPAVIRYSGATDFFDKIIDKHPEFETICGERPNVWLYIHGPAHHWAISAHRQAGRLLPAAEMFATFQCLLSGSFKDYPKDEFTNAWKAACFPDHGWGGNKGVITDALFKEKLEFARDKAHEIISKSLKGIAANIKTESSKGVPVVVFNSLSWQRSAPVECQIDLSAKYLGVFDSSGNAAVCQLIESGAEGSVVKFIAEEVPPLGYKTYYVKSVPKTQLTEGFLDGDIIENRFYRLKLGAGGLGSIFDKQLNTEVLKNDKFLGGEVFTMQSVGHGAGEFVEVQQPAMEGFDKVSLHKPRWRVNENLSGPVQTVIDLKQELENCVVKQRIVVYNTIKLIDFEITLEQWDGTESREFRMAMPVNLEKSDISYEVPLGIVQVGKNEIKGSAGGHGGSGSYNQKCSEVHPREVQNFITASGDDFALTLSSSVAVCDWIDPTDQAISSPILQPVLLASRKSCHGLGPWYLQAGDHSYRFSILSHEPGWENGYRFGIGANMPLFTVVNPLANGDASLPEQKKFFDISADNMLVSAIKKCDDDNSTIVRLYDIEGIDKTVQLKSFWDITRAEHTNIIELEGSPIGFAGSSVQFNIGHHAVETYKLFLKNKN
ncbi:MAG: discoidin domain-containing protein [Phycisphaerae bacterium]|nr:discoidin domain-containing protein [Phycisphaerae bacterium]